MCECPNVFDAAFRFDADDPPGYRCGEAFVGDAEIGRAAGGAELNVRLFELPPGEALCPYHYEYIEEWLLLLAGELELRGPAGVESLRTGALVCFPAGPDGAHKLSAPSSAGAPARVLMFSSAREPAVAVYPDSDKLAVFVPGGADNVLLRRADGGAGYFDGE